MLLPIYHTRLTLSATTTLDSSNSSLKPISCLKPRFRTPKTPQLLSKSAIQRITEKLQSLGYVSPDIDHGRPELGPDSPGDIFVSRPPPAGRVGHTVDGSWTSPDHPLPLPGAGPAFANFFKIKREMDDEARRGRGSRPPPAPFLAEVTVPAAELRRLRAAGIRLEKRLKVGKAGITEGIVNGIHERWRRSELVKIKCEDMCKMNMKRTHDTLERKTGGLVIWRSGSTIILYRGANYRYPYFASCTSEGEDDPDQLEDAASSTFSDNNILPTCGKPSNPNSLSKVSGPSIVHGVGSPNRVRFQLPGETMLEEEADRLLDGLGPRYTDWWGNNPLPVDADLLPGVVPGYRRPFRLLPFGVKPKLTDREMTVLRRLGRPLPCHFALGRNKNLHGLAAAMIKLWEKCEIAKIAVKRGLQNMNSELMAEELKRLTGGTLLSRDREFIVFYRGKDFLPPAVSTAIEERRKTILCTATESHSVDGKLLNGYYQDKKSSVPLPNSEMHSTNRDLQPVTEQKRLKTLASRTECMEAKLFQAIEKKKKVENLLEELEQVAHLKAPEVDKEGISEEERYMLRKVGLRMKAFLLLGRRGVFDGTVENMHLHWKYRELVKVICKVRTTDEVHKAALTLEAESGGILVAVERVSKGHAIIVYRGKNYQRPANLRPKNLLNKREALKRSLDAQRHQSLKLHVLKLSSDISNMKLMLEKQNSVVMSSTVLETDTLLDVVQAQEDKTDSKELSAPESTLIKFDAESVMTGVSAPTDAFVYVDEHIGLLPEYSEQCGQVDNNISSGSDDLECQSVQEKQDSADEAESRIVNIKDTMELASEPRESRPNSWRETDIQNDMDESDAFGAFKPTPLSNRERLLLRRQALKMRKRPVLAIGRNNVISGVAKAIKIHFQKNPLAIVNIKGRAKGTSVQELVIRLEQATGSVLVSQEPNKIILYRGWGEVDHHTWGSDKEREGRKQESKTASNVSAELMAAIRLECSWQAETSATQVGDHAEVR